VAVEIEKRASGLKTLELGYDPKILGGGVSRPLGEVKF